MLTLRIRPVDLVEARHACQVLLLAAPRFPLSQSRQFYFPSSSRHPVGEEDHPGGQAACRHVGAGRRKNLPLAKGERKTGAWSGLLCMLSPGAVGRVHREAWLPLAKLPKDTLRSSLDFIAQRWRTFIFYSNTLGAAVWSIIIIRRFHVRRSLCARVFARVYNFFFYCRWPLCDQGQNGLWWWEPEPPLPETRGELVWSFHHDLPPISRGGDVNVFSGNHNSTGLDKRHHGRRVFLPDSHLRCPPEDTRRCIAAAAYHGSGGHDRSQYWRGFALVAEVTIAIRKRFG